MATEVLLPNSTTIGGGPHTGNHLDIDEGCENHDGDTTYVSLDYNSSGYFGFPDPTISGPFTSITLRMVARRYNGAQCYIVPAVFGLGVGEGYQPLLPLEYQLIEHTWTGYWESLDTLVFAFVSSGQPTQSWRITAIEAVITNAGGGSGYDYDPLPPAGGFMNYLPRRRVFVYPY